MSPMRHAKFSAQAQHWANSLGKNLTFCSIDRLRKSDWENIPICMASCLSQRQMALCHVEGQQWHRWQCNVYISQTLSYDVAHTCQWEHSSVSKPRWPEKNPKWRTTDALVHIKRNKPEWPDTNPEWPKKRHYINEKPSGAKRHYGVGSRVQG